MPAWTSPARFRLPGLYAAVLAAACAGVGAQEVSPPLEGEPQVRRTVVEDRGARIDELRIRGQVRSISVRPSLPGARAYEVLPADTSRDAGDGAGNRRGAAGQRVWQLFSF